MQGKHIVLGISGSIAAYKSCTLIRLLVKAGAEVQVVITPSGKEFVTPTTLSALTSRPVISEFFAKGDGTWHSHVDLGLWADAMIIAPATAATLGKMAHGIADNMLITTFLSMKAPVFVAPAMDLDMFANPSTQANLATLASRGVRIIEPASGELASHLVGKGRMEEPEAIFRRLDDFFNSKSCTQRLSGKKVLVTAGPTHEKIDPVRFIGNHSSGKMGIALVNACLEEGAEVELVLGPIADESALQKSTRLHVTRVECAAEMHQATLRIFPTADAGILCAAVADYTVKKCSETKLKREGEMLLTLTPTPDIAADLGKMKSPGQRLVGFALETNDEIENARKKLCKKNFDFIVLNSLNDHGAGFACDTNKVTILTSTSAREYSLKHKDEVARDIIANLCDCF